MKLNDLRCNFSLSDITTEELIDAIEGLLERGLIEEVRNEFTDEISYRTTELGFMVKDHIDSDEETRN
jgi:hypothetical protein